MRLDDSAKRARDERGGDGRRERETRPSQRPPAARREPEPSGGGAIAEAFARALKKP